MVSTFKILFLLEYRYGQCHYQSNYHYRQNHYLYHHYHYHQSKAIIIVTKAITIIAISIIKITFYKNYVLSKTVHYHSRHLDCHNKCMY